MVRGNPAGGKFRLARLGAGGLRAGGQELHLPVLPALPVLSAKPKAVGT